MTNSTNDFAVARHQMVREQLELRGIGDSRVLEAFERVPRERFVPEGWESEAYADRALGIECEQTISQPYIVALMSEALQLSGRERVLEIGTGSGYQTAILAELAAEVFTVERHEALSREARDVLNELSYRNIHFRVGDGTLGWPEEAPFERVIVTAAARECPPALWEQLAEGGVLVGPFGDWEGQMLQAMRKIGGRAQIMDLTGCRFVPLVGGKRDGERGT